MTRLILVGGFLGAGKTTLLLQAARLLVERGLRTGLMTNDQGNELVDTLLAKEQNLPVVEVAGGCFCCRFPDLLEGLHHLQRTVAPDVILAEPVGSCTDLVATVVRPLMAQHGGEFDIAPLTVAVDSTRSTNGHAELIDYLYNKQIDEAEIIVLTKNDLVAPQEMATKAARLHKLYSPTPVYSLSARSGEGVAHWLDDVLSRPSGANRTLQIDYGQYAAAEAALGWLNTRGHVQASYSFSPKNWMTHFLHLLDAALSNQRAEIAHIKLQASAGSIVFKASLTHSGSAPSWDLLPPGAFSQQIQFVLNARVRATPHLLEQTVRRVFAEVTPEPDFQYSFDHFECFSPSPPRPTYRMETAEAGR
jgi:G3E family GTPase